MRFSAQNLFGLFVWRCSIGELELWCECLTAGCTAALEDGDACIAVHGLFGAVP